jgi:hypothetical protein
LKAVETKLSLERLVFGLIEVLWNYLACKEIFVMNSESTSFGIPRNDVPKILTVGMFKHVVDLARKGLANFPGFPAFLRGLIMANYGGFTT